MDDNDVWSSPDPAQAPAGSSSSPRSSFQNVASPSSSLAKQEARKSRGLFEDDDPALNPGWGAPTPSSGHQDADALPSDLTKEIVAPSAADEASSSASPSADTQHLRLERLSLHSNGDHTTTVESPIENEADEDEFADFDDPQPPSALAHTAAADDDFGDFGDFSEDPQNGATGDGFGGEAGFGEDFDDDFGGHEPVPAVVTSPIAEPSLHWKPLSVKPGSTFETISSQVQSILSPLPGYEGDLNSRGMSHLGKEHIRQVEGIAQVLVGESSRSVYTNISSAPVLRPVDWLRSRTRRDLHISLGVPINLDEIMPAESSSSSSRLPPLALKLESGFGASSGPRSAPSGNDRQSARHSSDGRIATPRTASLIASEGSGPTRSNSLSAASRSSAAATEGDSQTRSRSVDKQRKQRIMEKRLEDLGLGPPPEVDMKRVEELTNMSEDQLSLLTLPSLRALSSELANLTSMASTLLTHHLTLREALQSDSEMYNGLIKDLVTGAASRIAAGGGANGAGGGKKRLGTSGTGSGRNSPRPESPFARNVSGSVRK